MTYLLTFLITGLLCLIAQALLVYTKIGFLKLFILIICSGAILTFFDVMAYFEAYVTASIMTAGLVIYYGLLGLFAGDPSLIVGFIVMILCILICAIIVGVSKKINNEETTMNNE